ncbi:hypothetical protein [Actinomadura meridiana]|uniref:hypothetical protein n=1 Tax=Actinomadura meridiana TaxID=559626 RepID=UPI0031E815F8
MRETAAARVRDDAQDMPLNVLHVSRRDPDRGVVDRPEVRTLAGPTGRRVRSFRPGEQIRIVPQLEHGLVDKAIEEIERQ